MKNSTLKRWIFVALLVVLIAGTFLGHADTAGPNQNHVAIAAEPPAAFQQKMDEIAKRTRVGDGDIALGRRHVPTPTRGAAPQSNVSINGIFPVNILLWSDL